jgi:hypothetical protein
VLFKQIDLTGFEAGALGLHAHELVTLRIDSDGHRYAWLRICPELLDKVQSRACLLNDDAVRPTLPRKRNELALEIRKFQSSAGLAVGIVRAFVNALRRIRDSGVAMLLVQQNLEIAAALADTCVVLAAGRVVWRGSTRDATSNEEIRQAYFA